MGHGAWPMVYIGIRGDGQPVPWAPPALRALWVGLSKTLGVAHYLLGKVFDKPRKNFNFFSEALASDDWMPYGIYIAKR